MAVSAAEPATIAVLMTCHNRSAATLASLASLSEQRGVGQLFELDVYLVDAGSTDGTTDAVRAQHSDVHVIRSDDDTFWGHGMALAAAAAGHRHDYHLWLNDDVVLATDALRRLYDVAREGVCVVVGATCDASGERTYGGFRRGRRPLQFLPVGVTEQAERCDTVNGNVVLVPRGIVALVGSVDPMFPHAMGDIDFGLRARAAGFEVLQAGGFVGRCEGHPPSAFIGPALSRLRRRASIKQLPPRAWWTFCRRHGGAWFLAYFAKPYVVAMLRPDAA
jgi:GT2 family glycosyltransferase